MLLLAPRKNFRAPRSRSRDLHLHLLREKAEFALLNIRPADARAMSHCALTSVGFEDGVAEEADGVCNKGDYRRVSAFCQKQHEMG